MNWIVLENIDQLQKIKAATGYSLLFKHSTRCSISMMAKKKFEFEWDSLPAGVPVYFLDLIKYRGISNAVAEDFQVQHESPQLLLIKNGLCVYDTSHGSISAEDAAHKITTNA